jgi:hypothetical protein
LILPTDTARAALAAAAYDASREPTWVTCKNTRVFLDKGETHPIITFEGTRPTLLSDWMVDLDQLPFTIDTVLNSLPAGFTAAVLSVIFQIMHDFHGTPVGFNGHSMGAAEALLAAALWVRAGLLLSRVTAFEPPRVGKLGGLLTNEDVLITHCGTDPVPAVPSWKDHPYAVDALPNLGNWSPIACHEMANVQQALKAAA